MKKKLVTAILMLCMTFALCACGGNTDDTEGNTDNDKQQESQMSESEEDSQTESENDDKVTYKITVVDEGGNPVSGAMVQLCDDANCMPKLTDANGAAIFSVEEFDGYMTKVTSVPEGYEIISDEYTYFEGETEVTLTVKAVK